MKVGLRLQILLSLGALLGLGFVPLYFAISTYTQIAVARSRAESAQRLASATAEWISRAPESAVKSDHLLPFEAMAEYSADGLRITRRVGAASGALPALWSRDPDRTATAWAVGRAQSDAHKVLVLVDPGRPDQQALQRLLAFYMALIAAALVVGVYFTITAWIIRPLDQFSRATTRFGSATHRLQLPTPRSREFALLAESLGEMTSKLAAEQSALVQKVEELQQARAALERAQAQIVRGERLASVGQLAAGLAHEVGNPIAALQGMQDLILTGDLDQEQQLDFTRRMRKETERISRIIRDLLDFARPNQRAGSGNPPGNVEVAVNEVVALVSHQPALRDVDLALDVHPDLPHVRISHEHLTQVLLNLILNAAAACKDGGNVSITAKAADRVVRVTVRDDGPGVPKDLRDRIFEPFVSTKEVGEGSGLGLSVCRGLVEAAGGRIWLDPDTSSGAQFIVELELAPEAAQGERTSVPERRSSPSR